MNVTLPCFSSISDFRHVILVSVTDNVNRLVARDYWSQKRWTVPSHVALCLLAPPFPTGRDALLVTDDPAAVARFYRAAQWPTPANFIDLSDERPSRPAHRQVVNLPPVPGDSLDVLAELFDGLGPELDLPAIA